MSKRFYTLLMLLTVSVSCAGDMIDITDEPTSSGSSTSTELKDANLSWSASSCDATLGSDNTFPSLSNPYALDINYSSGDESVATISSNGTVTLVAVGTTEIKATSVATSEYEASSVSYTLNVNLASNGLSWSASSCTASLIAEDNTYPTLTNTHNLAVKYSSSDTSVATISQDGTVTLVSAGSTTIMATTEATGTYEAGSASYTLKVISGSDDGAGTYTYGSTGDPTSDDDISNTTFTRKITVTFASGAATVTGDYYGYATVSGKNVTVNNTGSECIVYELKGTSSNGSFTLYSTKKQAILLNGVSL
ncbi:MAG: Ig-like domain-containing protein, partial [Bacteroidales bacterium]|nr:Ig-like domain-containing protein [Bacteroidales bacterium]